MADHLIATVKVVIVKLKLVLIHNLSDEVRSEKISLFQRSARKGLGSMEPSVKPFHEEVKLAKSRNVSICFIQAALAK